MASRQLNLRFDEQQHDVVRRVVDRLRNDSSFLGALEALLASGIDPAGDRHALDTLARLAQLAQTQQPCHEGSFGQIEDWMLGSMVTCKNRELCTET
jgi:hypothetical protein